MDIVSQTIYKIGQKCVRILFRVLIYPDIITDSIPDPIPDSIPDPILDSVLDMDGIPNGTNMLRSIYSKLFLYNNENK